MIGVLELDIAYTSIFLIIFMSVFYSILLSLIDFRLCFEESIRLIAIPRTQRETVSENDNLIIRGNNLLSLASVLRRFEEKIKCIYIDIKTPRLIQFNYSSADFAA